MCSPLLPQLALLCSTAFPQRQLAAPAAPEGSSMCCLLPQLALLCSILQRLLCSVPQRLPAAPAMSAGSMCSPLLP